MSKEKLIYANDRFLNIFKSRFDEDFLEYYKNRDKERLVELFTDPDNIIDTNRTFDYIPLAFESENLDVTIENIKTIKKSLGFLTPTEASNEKLWVALLNRYYLDYHFDQLSTVNKDDSIKSRTIFVQGRKRSLTQNSLSILWWIDHYTYDEGAENPYHLTEYLVDGSYRGNVLPFLSSNIVSNRTIAKATLEAIKDLTDEKVIKENRYAYTQANKFLNQINGVSLIDALTRDEIYSLVKEQLPKMDQVILLSD